MPGSELLPTAAVAVDLEVDVRTVHRWVETGAIIPVTKAPGLRGPYMFDRSEVERVKAERDAAAKAVSS